MAGFDHDVVIIGSGFGGSVSALRLTEKGYRVAVLESGRRFDADTLPKTNWDARNFLWFPKLGMKGIMRMTLLKDVFIVSGAGVGGGSLVYANTLYEPLRPYYEDPQWSHISDWEDEYAPFYDQAKRMLGVVETPTVTNADRVLQEVAERLGCEDTWHPTPVGVYFGEAGQTVDDPYFGGEGPSRTGCTECGGCMVGCRFNAKNTLDNNYLYLAEKNGAEVFPEHTVVDVQRIDGGWQVTTERSGAWFRKERRTFSAEQVIFSAASLGTQKLLHTLKDEGRLPALSPALGSLTRTNSEAIVGATANSRDTDYSEGVAITSSIHPDDVTHIEPVRYPKGSNQTSTLTTLMVDGGGSIPRWLRLILTILLHPLDALRSLNSYRWSEKSIILLVMQAADNSLQTFRKRGLFGHHLSTKQGHGEPNPTYIPVANQAAREAADVMGGGVPFGSIFEATLNVPTTAHFIGGCPIGDSPRTGVVDPYHRVYGYEGLHICDGSVITANLGVNPSLSITAMTERAIALWPNEGEVDQRPPLGSSYERIAPVPPRNPAVPEQAPAALRLPIVSVSSGEAG